MTLEQVIREWNNEIMPNHAKDNCETCQTQMKLLAERIRREFCVVPAHDWQFKGKEDRSMYCYVCGAEKQEQK